ncbi:leucine-rich repeat protein, partial [Pseudoflavonifractor capillosus]|uniref:leucine-rich repeat protein n=1 Tax=Pseudoflavonifractor capillosus TaxID=106588 RepID=UPI00195858EB
MSENKDFVIKKGVLGKYKGSSRDVVIPKRVTEIGESAFEDCTGLTNVTIPEGVTKIGEFAFLNCTGLT